MENHLLEYIEIKNFKCFDDFKAEGFKRVNLIGGKNNVGKTALMEACYINIYAQEVKSFLFSLVRIKFRREFVSIFSSPNLNLSDFLTQNIKGLIEQCNHIITQSNMNLASYKIEEKEGVKSYIFEFNNQEIKVNTNQFSFEVLPIQNIIFIDNVGLSDSDIIYNYSAIQKQDAELILNTLLNEFDPRIQAFKIIDEKPQCKINGQYLEITELGDGSRHLVSIVTSLYKTQNGYLFIDEIDNGIHYTMLDKLWETVLTLAKQQNVQVFATTHSKECIESYYRAAKKLEEQDIAYIRLSRLKSGKIKAGVHDYELLENSIGQSYEVRGW
ncbi:AAA family ATPase [Candidatus Albibeggiatoa sp. nov. BB20]|uniref:AAA family ATPase n=1 Tax=Candidatus Albibeggiatoa sp. nov. BB20 TaxID=3162723 RepID=UPI00336553FA